MQLIAGIELRAKESRISGVARSGVEIDDGVERFAGADPLIHRVTHRLAFLVEVHKRQDRTARNFNPMMATAATITIAEVEEIVPVGTIDPDHIITPGLYVDRIIKGNTYEKRIEQRTTQK